MEGRSRSSLPRNSSISTLRDCRPPALDCPLRRGSRSTSTVRAPASPVRWEHVAHGARVDTHRSPGPDVSLTA